MASVNLETLKTSGLEKRIRNSIFSRNYKVIDSYISDNLRRKGDNFFIPTIQTIVDGNPELEKELIDLYNRKFPMGGTEDIDYEIKLLQASVLDGLVVGINTEKDGDFQIYTANIGTIFGIDNESKFNIDKTLDLNRKRIVHAMRVDVEYTSEEGFNYKIVSLNKNTNLHIVDLETFEGRFHLVPYIAIQRSMAFFKEMLDDMRILNVKQDKGEMHKERYITSRKDILSKYSDNEEFAKSLGPSYFPLKGFFYAPVLGADSLTSGVTRIDLLDVCRVDNVASVENISKPEGGIKSIVRESSIMSIFNRMYEEDAEGYQAFVDSLPSNDILTGAVFDIDKGVPKPDTLIKYLHSLNSKDRRSIEDSIPGLDWEISKRSNILTKYEELNIDDYSSSHIRSLLYDGVYKFVIQKKDCHYSTITATNNEDILKALYGDDYFAKYESFGVRLREFESYLEDENYVDDNAKIEEWLKHCGFSTDAEIVEKVKSLWSSGSLGAPLHGELLELLGTSKTGTPKKTTKRSSYNDSLILARVLPGSLDFYRYIDMSKVVAMYRLG